jgi:hypothetical protein
MEHSFNRKRRQYGAAQWELASKWERAQEHTRLILHALAIRDSTIAELSESCTQHVAPCRCELTEATRMRFVNAKQTIITWHGSDKTIRTERLKQQRNMVKMACRLHECETNTVQASVDEFTAQNEQHILTQKHSNH